MNPEILVWHQVGAPVPPEEQKYTLNMNRFSEGQWYENYYSMVSTTANAESFANRLLHKSIELPFKSNRNLTILEVGANQGEHLPYVAADYKQYILSDLRSPKKELAYFGDSRISFQIADVQQLPFRDLMFDRVIATCLLLHLDNPLSALEEIHRVTKAGGVFSLLLPHDPGIMYRIARRVTSLRKAKRIGVLEEAEYVHAVAHRNHFLSMKKIIQHQCINDEITVKTFPFRFSSYDLNLFSVVHVRKS